MTYLNNGIFKKVGYLTELNRLYLNPLGLHMVLENNELKVQDYRERREGTPPQELDEYEKSKSQFLTEEYGNRRLYRLQKYGWVVQPIEEQEDHLL